MSNPEQETWWASFYDDAFACVVMDTGEDSVSATTADFLMERLELRPGSRVFDQCCGLGRVAIPLARRGVHVVGVDITPGYIRSATAAAAGLPCELHVGDAFEFVPDAPCDAAFNWWSSFGYTAEDERNATMLRRAWEALKPGGRFAMDYYSVPRLLREFQESVRIVYRTRHGEFPVTRAARVDFPAGMIEQDWSYVGPEGEEHRKRSRTKMYLPHELHGMLQECGFQSVEVYGGYDGQPFTFASPRCVLTARKP